MTPTISVLGCGYVGLPVAKALIARGWRVRGSTTQEEKLRTLLRCGIEPYQLRLTPELTGRGIEDFFSSEVVFLNFPPGRRRQNVELFFAQAMDSLISALRVGEVKRVVFASSTSVYASGRVTESDVDLESVQVASGRALLNAESSLQQEGGFSTTVLRYGGLYGYERRPGRFLLGRKVTGGNRVVNLVHRDDAVNVAVRVMEQGVENEVFNVCADEHPTRRTFYTQAAKWLGYPQPEFANTDDTPNKVVLNDKLRLQLPYEFVHPDPMRKAP